jgi:hypothetical protein
MKKTDNKPKRTKRAKLSITEKERDLLLRGLSWIDVGGIDPEITQLINRLKSL